MFLSLLFLQTIALILVNFVVFVDMDVYVDSGPFKLSWLFTTTGISLIFSLIFASTMTQQISLRASTALALTCLFYSMFTTIFGFMWTYKADEVGSLFENVEDKDNFWTETAEHDPEYDGPTDQPDSPTLINENTN